MIKITRIYVLISALLLASCVTIESPATPTQTPENATQTQIPTPEATQTPEPIQILEIISNSDFSKSRLVTRFGEVIFSYPADFNPICDPRDLAGTLYPCSWVFNRDDGFLFEVNEIAGFFGFGYDPMVLLRPSDEHRYLVRCDVRQNRSPTRPLFSDSNFGVVARFLDDELPDNHPLVNAGVLTLPRQETDTDSHVWLIEVTQEYLVSFECGISIDWASYPDLDFTYSYMSILLVPMSYEGEPISF